MTWTSYKACHPLFYPRMSVLSQVVWTNLCYVLWLAGAGLGAVIAVLMTKLLVRHAWYKHRQSCFSTPPTHSWLLGHLGQVGDLILSLLCCVDEPFDSL